MAGSIKQLGKNKYKVTLYMGRINGERKDVRKVIDGPKKVAEQYLNEKIREKYLGEYSEPSKMLLADHMNEWFDKEVKTRVKAKTYQNYSDLVKYYIEPALGGNKTF